ncbi:MAG TPA: phosphoribosylformylglycinamidine cyclo-ligase [Drouetiella sp.]
MENTYAAAGVDVLKAEAFVGRLKKVAKRPGHEKLWAGAGGYASVVPISDSQAVALTTDGVGTKLLIAAELNKLDTIGIDLVAMCANDLVCVGAKPLSFLDYYATPKLIDRDADEIITGIAEGCDQAGILLVGGETAELPDLYAEKHFDLAGFAMGMVSKTELITGADITPGDVLIGVGSSGIHSNGFSLARKVIAKDKWDMLLAPTLIYVKPVVELFNAGTPKIKGIAHITGGGWRNLFRLKDGVGFTIDNPLPEPPIYSELRKHVAQEELFKTFNMGMGLVVIVKKTDADSVIKTFTNHKFQAQLVGQVTDQNDKLSVVHNGASFEIAN